MDLRMRITDGQSAPGKTAGEQPWKVPYFRRRQTKAGVVVQHDGGVLCRQFQPLQHLVKNYTATTSTRVASGGLESDYHWTEVLMKQKRGRTETWGAGDERLFRCIITPCPRATGRTRVPPPNSSETEWFNTFRRASGHAMNSSPNIPPSWTNMTPRKKSA